MVSHPILEDFKDILRANFLEFTRRAYRSLPPQDRPRILDLGCGSGVPTRELARMSRGKITAVDIDQPALDRLTARAFEAGIGSKITVVNRSIEDLDLYGETFDIVWSEGAVFVLGFEHSLKAWKRFLVPGGFLVVHDEAEGADSKIMTILKCGYSQHEMFKVPEDIWRDRYFGPMEKKLVELESRASGDPALALAMEQDRRELEMFKSDPGGMASAFIVMRLR